MMPNDLKSLIAELESAKEGSRELDAKIAVAISVDLPKPMGEMAAYLKVPPPIDKCEPADRCELGTYWLVQRSGMSLRTALPYTFSIDSALTLVPEGARIELQNISTVPDGVFGCVVYTDYLNDGPVFTAGSYQPALALCIKALRAKDEA